MTIELAEEKLEGEELMEINLPREELYALMLEAHKRDITLNALITMVLRAKMIEEGWDPDTGEFVKTEDC